ncbi:histidine phosphatase family protein [Candidatus Pelagibacter sp. Uisw_127]|uniref:histidine phosphatase family protein n=1 Tax=Candidatus Pelagibacter sp. Uisw_127 TaxID=3230988 RepID=UPI0039EA23EF
MKLIKIIIFLLISFNTSLKANSENNVQNILNKGGKLIFIRHAYAPGGGDPDNFEISNCASQRNLNEEGIEQSKRIGNFFLKKDIMIDKILSSEWCRCKQTAKYAFKNYETKSFLNSFFSKKFADNKDKQIKELKEYIKKWNGKSNLIFVTHYVVILEILNISVLSGEIVVADKDFNILARQKTSIN